MWEYQATIVSVHDADTLTVMADLGFYTYQQHTIRLAGVNAPELNTEEGRAARDHVRALLPPGTACVIRTKRYGDTEKYGRWLAGVYANGVDLATDLLERGYAVPYPL